MHLSSNRDLKQYWRLLDKISPNTKRNTGQGPISAKDWVKYIKLKFHSENVCLSISDGEGRPLDYEITREEMMDLSHILKNGKSPGLANITNEVIACALRCYSQTLPVFI